MRTVLARQERIGPQGVGWAFLLRQTSMAVRRCALAGYDLEAHRFRSRPFRQSPCARVSPDPFPSSDWLREPHSASSA
jgi:hypothetical protein